MFYGLNEIIKNLLPKKLFYRSLIIIITPIILLQVIISVVFFDSLWIKANKGMTKSLVGEVRTIVDVYEKKEEENIKMITDLYNKNFNFAIVYKKNEILPTIKKERWFSPIDRSLRRELKSAFGQSYWFDSISYKNTIDLRIADDEGVLEIFFPKNKITTSSARIFAIWITIPVLILIFIFIIFIKNQTRPIVSLARSAEKFGKGEYIKEFRPSGALEIRQAAYEFDRMRKRITRHLNQRSEMLSGISHDLRTPLTRLKLQIAFIKDENIALKMSDDINEMEKMLNEYLDFASDQKNEKSEIINIEKLLKSIIAKYEGAKIDLFTEDDIEINGRHNSIKRCLINLIDNATSYGKKINISVKKTLNKVIILIEDDGPGIAANERENAFKPFYRIDKSRSQNKSGVGLGLSIANDIIKAHGGDISLGSSRLKGLSVKISLPI